MGSPAVSDDVWQALDPSLDKLSPSARRGVIALYASALVIAALVLAGWHVGALNPRYREAVVRAEGTGGAAPRVQLVVRVHNSNDLDAHVTAVRVAAPGATLTAPSSVELTIPAHHSRRIPLRLRIDDCSAVSRQDAIRVQIVTEHFWGHLTSTPTWVDEIERRGLLWDTCHPFVGRHR